MHPTVVADPGGLLVAAGLLQGADHEVDEIVALDASSLLLAEYLAVRHEDAPDRARADYGLVIRVVGEWFPVRALALDAAVRATDNAPDVTGLASLGLAESLDVPLITKNHDLTTDRIPVLYC